MELTPGPQYAHAMREIEVTFLASPGGMEVVLEADKPGGLFSSGHDAVNCFTVSHQGVDQRDWNAEVEGWVRQLAAGHSAHAPHDHGRHHHGDSHHRSGPGTGTVVAAGAAGLAVGVVGGMVAAEVVDEVGDFFEADDEEGEEG